MSLDSLVGKPFNLNDGKMGRRVGDGTYTNTVDLFSLRMMVVRLQPVTDTLEGDGIITGMASAWESAEIEVEIGGHQPDVIENAYGITETNSGTTPNQVNRLRVPGGKNLPYVGIGGTIPSEDNPGAALAVWAPQAKIMSAVETTIEKGRFFRQRFTMRAIPDTNFLDADDYPALIDVLDYETQVAMTLPPSGAA